MRDILRSSADGFPLQAMIDRFKGTTKSLACTDDDIENLLGYSWGKGYTFSILRLLYPWLNFRNRFHIDHIHPRSGFTRSKLRKKGISEADVEFYMENFNLLPNLQLLEGIPNQEKSDAPFADWLSQCCSTPDARESFTRQHFIPSTDLAFTNFRQFIEQRREKLRQKLRIVLGVQEDAASSVESA